MRFADALWTGRLLSCRQSHYEPLPNALDYIDNVLLNPEGLSQAAGNVQISVHPSLSGGPVTSRLPLRRWVSLRPRNSVIVTVGRILETFGSYNNPYPLFHLSASMNLAKSAFVQGKAVSVLTGKPYPKPNGKLPRPSVEYLLKQAKDDGNETALSEVLPLFKT